jgi:hypothetical protein
MECLFLQNPKRSALEISIQAALFVQFHLRSANNHPKTVLKAVNRFSFSFPPDFLSFAPVKTAGPAVPPD